MKDTVFGSTAATRSGSSNMFVTWIYGAYFPTLSFPCSSAVMLLIDQETCIAGLRLMVGVGCLDWMKLAGSDDSCETCETRSTGHSAGIGVGATDFSGSLRKASMSLVFENRYKDELLLLSYYIVACFVGKEMLMLLFKEKRTIWWLGKKSRENEREIKVWHKVANSMKRPQSENSGPRPLRTSVMIWLTYLNSLTLYIHDGITQF